MKKAVVAAILVCVFGQINAQKYRVGFSVSPDMAYRKYVSENDTLGGFWGEDQQPTAGYTATIWAERKLTEKLYLYTGLLFTHKGYQSKEREIRYSIPPPPNAEYRAHRYKYSFYQFGIPVGVNYFIPLKKFKLFVGGGISINLLQKVMYTSISYGVNGTKNKISRTEYDLKDYQRLALYGYANTGAEIPLKKELSFRVFANTAYSFSNVVNDGFIYSIYPYSIGLGFGIYKNF